jgi:hypothetical protein
MTAWQKHWSLVAGILFGFVLLPVVLVEYEAWALQRRTLQQQSEPVITTEVKVLVRDEEAALIEVRGDKRRDCEFAGIVAITFDENARSDTTSAQRVDQSVTGTTRPRGPFYAGVWRVMVKPEQSALLEALYTCHGVPVRSVFATIDRADPPP